MPDLWLVPDSTEMAALHEQQITLEICLLEAIDDGCPAGRLSAMLTRIALLSADLRRN